MVEQSGIKSFSMYRAETVTFDNVSETEIQNVAGTKIDVTHCGRPNLENSIQKINRKIHNVYTFSFVQYGLSQDNFSQFRNVFGWVVLVEFMNGGIYLVDEPVFLNQSEFVTNNTNKYPLGFTQNRPGKKIFKVIV